MLGAIDLVERQKGQVAGLVAIAMEDTPRALGLRQSHRIATAILPNTQWQAECNAQTLKSFETYTPSDAFPKSGA